MIVWQQLLQVNWYVVFFSNAMRIRTKNILIRQWVIINISDRRLEMTLFSAYYDCQCTLPFLSLCLVLTPIRYLACLSWYPLTWFRHSSFWRPRVVPGPSDTKLVTVGAYALKKRLLELVVGKMDTCLRVVTFYPHWIGFNQGGTSTHFSTGSIDGFPISHHSPCLL